MAMTKFPQKRQGSGILPIVMIFTLVILILGLTIVELFRFSLYNRRISNFAQSAAQTAANLVLISDRHMTLPSEQEVCDYIRNFVRDSLSNRQIVWDLSATRRSQLLANTRVSCRVKERNLVEVTIYTPYYPTVLPVLPEYNFGYGRARLVKGIREVD